MSKVILFRGKAGVGKTYISTLVGQALNIAIVRKDDIYDSTAGYIEAHEMRNEICNEAIRKIVATNIECGVDVIVDTTYHYMNQVLDFRSWVLSQGADFISITCICSDEQLWAVRFNKRKQNPKPNNLITDFEELRSHYKSLDTEMMDGELVLDSVYNINELVSAATEYINKR